MAQSAVTAITNGAELVALNEYRKGLIVLNFWAQWSEPSKALNTVFEQLAQQHNAPGVRFASVEAEEVGDVTEKYGIDAVPAFVFLKDGQVLEVLKGANPPELTKKVLAFVQTHGPAGPSVHGTAQSNSKEELNKRLHALINSHKVMAFIKGTNINCLFISSEQKWS